MDLSQQIEIAQAALRKCPTWFHSIELAPGVVTPGRKSADTLQKELHSIKLPDLRGKSVLDIGAYDGFFSFAAERLGAARVVALDHYIWSTDMEAYTKEWEQSRRTGETLPPPHLSRHWHPEGLPGRRPFDLAHEALGSKVEIVVGDFMTIDASNVGQFDIVLFMGVLYHMEEPLTTLRRLASFTAQGGLAVIETAAVDVPMLRDSALFEFYPGSELNNDPSNWWSPNAKALEGLCRAAGFREAKLLTKRPRLSLRNILRGATRYRAIAHAWM